MEFDGRGGGVHAALAGAVILVAVLAGCSAVERSPAAGSPSASAQETDSMGDNDNDDDDDGDQAQEVDFDELLSDPAAFVGQPVRVTGNVFFIAECPPPGSANADCVLFGYLADPERRTLIAADVGQTIAIAEGGRRLTCVEGSRPTPTCGDWKSESTYTIDGVVQQQVLGGRETSLVQLDVSEKSVPQPW
jgi:hypothetical protein